MLVITPSSSGQILTSSQTVSGSIAAPNEADTYELNLMQGEPYYLVATKAGGDASFQPNIDFFRPDGTLITFAHSYSAATLTGFAPITGTYSVTVHDYTDWSLGLTTAQGAIECAST